VAALAWNQWQDSRGIGGSFGVEYASAKATYHLTGYLGISHTLWAEACVVLGEQAAAVCVVVIDHAMHREDNPVRKPNGYFRSRLRKAERGELHLHRSIFGILKRGRRLIDAQYDCLRCQR
jgi:Replication protein C C-terminal region